MRKNILKDEAGLITLDFIFALSMAFSFSVIFFAIAFTLSMVEVGQYVTYATARAYLGAHETESLQQQIAKQKFDDVISGGALKRLVGNGNGKGWIKLGPPSLGDHNQNNEYGELEKNDNDVFVGAQVPFEARVLNLKLPVLGATAQDSETGKATLNAYLMREVSSEECRTNFVQRRYSKLRAIDPSYGKIKSQTPEVFISDNGC